MPRFLCIHGHFYQPPREDPWTGEVEVENSAGPFHDWNERITAECYEPNLGARILDREGHVMGRINNYSRMSFNFGPTLLAWMEKRVPSVYQGILDSDQESRRRFSGHGSALAQAYNHVVLPLATRRDKETQIVWGRKDFEFRFGRPAEGMWLPETAVDLETLEILAEQGVRFTILAPHQARRVRKFEEADWRQVSSAGIEPLRPYRIFLAAGRFLDLFFYDGQVSQAVAFQHLLSDGATFLDRLLSRFSGDPSRAELVHIATDGETYGHHHKFGEMALAYILSTLEAGGEAQLTNYGEYLERFPPTAEVEIVENSSWSCPHGVARWRSDCGCSTGGSPGWNQAWREPLREALEGLRDAWTDFYQQEVPAYLRDPWAARNDAIELTLDPSAKRRQEYFSRHAVRPLTQAEQGRVADLLELQRQAQLMFTSCAWFFDDPSGLETAQILKYARKGLELARGLSAPDREQAFLEKLARGRSNLSDRGTLRDIFLATRK